MTSLGLRLSAPDLRITASHVGILKRETSRFKGFLMSAHKHKHETPNGYNGYAIFDACTCGLEKKTAGSRTEHPDGRIVVTNEKDHAKYEAVVRSNPVRTRA